MYLLRHQSNSAFLYCAPVSYVYTGTPSASFLGPILKLASMFTHPRLWE